ncbi:MAG: type II toxin-antitoxin system VapC family toxin [Luteolibacter sp.]
MVIAADTSFLFSLYGNDSKTPDAVVWSERNSQAIVTTSLNRFELLNALRFAECRQFIGKGDAVLFASQFEVDLNDGRLIAEVCNLAEILSEANRISSAHTLTSGHRGFDILHVAAAKILDATHFLTFDANQKKLAENEGLVVPF